MVVERLKKLFGRESEIRQADLDRMAGLPEEQKDDALQSMLYELAFQNAVKFTFEELKKKGLFGGLEKDTFFNEILIMNFWMMEKVFSKYRAGTAEKMHTHYFGKLPDIADRTADLIQRIETYDLCWGDDTGRHEEFGFRVGEILFGKERAYPDKTVSFWLISYADNSIKKFKKARKQVREAGLIIKIAE